MLTAFMAINIRLFGSVDTTTNICSEGGTTNQVTIEKSGLQFSKGQLPLTSEGTEEIPSKNFLGEEKLH